MFKRNCPKCDKKITYVQKSGYNRASKLQGLCKSCAKKGENNSFYGKHHSDSTKNILSEKSSNRVHTEQSKRIRSAKMTGKKNSMYGRNFYDIWVKRYGIEEANRKLVLFRKKQSIRTSGKKNPMYGKPSPHGSGNGWSGWYKGWYFRSLRELSYVINHLEKNGLKWSSAEKKKFTIPYKDWDGTDRIYRPDFFVEDKKLVEVKPNKLKQATTVNLKAKAAEKFCKKNGYEYEMVEGLRLKDEQILKLYKDGEIKFLDRYEEKFKEKYLE